MKPPRASSTSAGSAAITASIGADIALSSAETAFAYSFANVAMGFKAAVVFGSSIVAPIVESSA